MFLTARDPKWLADWYREHRGIPVESGQTHGMMTSSGAGEMTVWSTFPAHTAYSGPGPATAMVNYRVKNLDAMMAQLRAGGAMVEEKVEGCDCERFGWASDSGGNHFEL